MWKEEDGVEGEGITAREQWNENFEGKDGSTRTNTNCVKLVY